MRMKVYVAALTCVGMSVMFVPEWTELVKVYVISVVVLVTALINILFRIAWLREYVVNKLVTTAIQEILKDRDIQKLIKWGKRRGDSQRIKG